MAEEKRSEGTKKHRGEDFAVSYPFWLLLPIGLLFIVIWGWFKLFYGLKIQREKRLEDLKGPVIYLGNHCSLLDFFFMSIAFFPRRIHYVMSNVFLAKWWGKPVICGLQQIPKSQFFAEAKSVMTMKRAVKRGCSIGIYPEGRIALTGCTGYIAPAIGKLVKSFGAPVVIVKETGFCLRKPLWARKSRRGPVELDCRLLLNSEEITALSAEEIYERIRNSLAYDDYRRQEEIKTLYGRRGRLAEGLELILHRCPACGKELAMESAGDRLFCSNCGFAVTLDPANRLTPEKGSWPGPVLEGIPAWYQWQAAEMEQLLTEPGYHFSSPVNLKVLSKETFQERELGPARLNLSAGGIGLEELGEKPQQLLHFGAGQLPTITGTLGRFVDLPGLEALYRPFFQDRRLPVFWMQAVEALAAVRNTYREKREEMNETD